MSPTPREAATSAQVDKLIDYMAEHPDFARGQIRSANAHAVSETMWSDLSTMLNSIGTQKTVEQWKTVYSYRKSKLKEKLQPKLAVFQNDKTQNVRQFFHLDERESKLEEVLNYAASLMNTARPFGVGTPVSEREAAPRRQSIVSTVTRPSTSSRVRAPTRHSSRRNHSNEAMVRGLSQRHEERSQRLAGHLQSITTSVEEINKSLQQINALRRNEQR